jgi:2,3-bisphosphoglycerate-dependent phosphoglycerate mutase
LSHVIRVETWVDDCPLTELGREQARRLGEWCATQALTRVWTSPFLRTLETSREIQATTGLNPIVWTDLHEHGGCIGIDGKKLIPMPGMTGDEIRAQFPGYEVPDDIGDEGWWKRTAVEDTDQAVERIQRVITAMRDGPWDDDDRVVFVSHGTFINFFVKILIGLNCISKTFTGPSNTGVTHIDFGLDAMRIRRYNGIAHLTAEMVTE